MSKKRACAEAGSICGPKKSKLVDASSKLELLPDPQIMSYEAKSISSKMKNAFHTMDELDLFNQSKNVSIKSAKTVKMSWIIGKYVWNTVHPIASCLNSIPSSLTEAQKKKFLEKACPGKEKEIVHKISFFVAEHYPIFVLSLPKVACGRLLRVWVSTSLIPFL